MRAALGARCRARSAASTRTHAAPSRLLPFSFQLPQEGSKSTAMNDALKVMAIGGLMRQAIKLVRGCNIMQTGEGAGFYWWVLCEEALQSLPTDPTNQRQRMSLSWTSRLSSAGSR